MLATKILHHYAALFGVGQIWATTVLLHWVARLHLPNVIGPNRIQSGSNSYDKMSHLTSVVKLNKKFTLPS